MTVLKPYLLAAVLSAVVFAAPVQAQESTTATAGALSEKRVEEIVRDYIMNNADVILKSVDEYQRKGISARQNDALQQNHAELYQNERAPVAGNPKGDVTIVEFFDYNCGYCKHVLPDVKKLIETDKNLKVIFKEFPILGPTSELASKWALAAHKQDKYFAFHQRLMERKGPINEEALSDVAKAVGLDVAQAKKDAAGADIATQLEKNRSLGGQLGLAGTPAFIIGEEVVPGAVPLSDMRAKVAEARKKAAGAKTEKKTDDKTPAKD